MLTLPACRDVVAQVFSLLGVESRGLDEHGAGLLVIGHMQLGLQLDALVGTLRADAVVYTFRAPPRAGLLERLNARATQMALGEGLTVAYVEEHQVLVVRRVFQALPAAPALLDAFKAQLQAAAHFADEGIGGL